MMAFFGHQCGWFLMMCDERKVEGHSIHRLRDHKLNWPGSALIIPRSFWKLIYIDAPHITYDPAYEWPHHLSRRNAFDRRPLTFSGLSILYICRIFFNCIPHKITCVFVNKSHAFFDKYKYNPLRRQLTEINCLQKWIRCKNSRCIFG